jgi:nicotinamidase-related amidase
MEHTQDTALLVMDMQVGILGMLPDAAAIISKVGDAIAKARQNHVPVIYVTVGFRPGLPEVSMNNKSFAAFKPMLSGMDMKEFVKVHPELAPQAGEVTLVKRRFSAFTGSDLEVILRAFGVQHLVLTGISTSGVVLSTVREAADKDYRLTVLSDCCADNDEEVHGLLMTKVFPGQADVRALNEWVKP